MDTILQRFREATNMTDQVRVHDGAYVCGTACVCVCVCCSCDFASRPVCVRVHLFLSACVRGCM